MIIIRLELLYIYAEYRQVTRTVEKSSYDSFGGTSLIIGVVFIYDIHIIISSAYRQETYKQAYMQITCMSCDMRRILTYSVFNQPATYLFVFGAEAKYCHCDTFCAPHDSSTHFEASIH